MDTESLPQKQQHNKPDNRSPEIKLQLPGLGKSHSLAADLQEPAGEIHTAVDNIAVEPFNGCGNIGKDDPMGDEEPYFIHVKFIGNKRIHRPEEFFQTCCGLCSALTIEQPCPADTEDGR